MAHLYDRNGNVVFFPDSEIEAALKEKWLVHRRTEPRWFKENPDKRTSEEKLSAGIEGVHRRATIRAGRIKASAYANLERMIAAGTVPPEKAAEMREKIDEQLAGFVEQETARVMAKFLASDNPKQKAIAEGMRKTR